MHMAAQKYMDEFSSIDGDFFSCLMKLICLNSFNFSTQQVEKSIIDYIQGFRKEFAYITGYKHIIA